MIVSADRRLLLLGFICLCYI